MAAKNDPATAAEHLLSHLRHIAGQVPSDTGLIPLILDGENAWETFADGGEAFLRTLYGGIEADAERLQSCTIEDYFHRHPPQKQLTTLHTGSWISSNFDIWIGEDEENRAWDLLGETRAFLQRQIDAGALTPEARAAALREIYAAEGSDWFWWYGPDFSTDNDALFDDLFRLHLKNVYALCGGVAPAALDVPIGGTRALPLYSVPERLISPAMGAGPDSFFDWIGAGRYVAGSEQGAMYRAERIVSKIEFGNDERTLFLRVDLRKWEPLALTLQFLQPVETLVCTGLLTRGGAGEFTIEKTGAAKITRSSLVVNDAIEFAIPLADLGLAGGAPVAFQVRVFRDGIERECYPENAPIQFTLLGADFALRNWIV